MRDPNRNEEMITIEAKEITSLTCPGPIIVPVQFVIIRSSESSNPYEHDPSPIPFSPLSSSSSRRKFLGTVPSSHKTQ